MIVIEDIINSKDKMLELGNLAKEDSNNFVNFKNRIDNYLTYHVAKYNDKVIAMAGMFQTKFWNPKFVRVLDRCYYFKIARSSALSFLNDKELKATASTHFLPKQIEIALSKNLIPFFSIQGIKRRPAMYRMVERWNKNNKNQFIILPKLYFTCNSKPNDNTMCWQNIAVLKIEGYEDFNLPSKTIK